MSKLTAFGVEKLTDRLSITVHGFRNTFRYYIGEVTDYDHRLAEYALAHVLKDATEKAYARGEQLEKRFSMMQEWGKYAMSGINETWALLRHRVCSREAGLYSG